MEFLSYINFLLEKENVKLQKELREYTLTHMGADRFQLKSEDFYKDFSVLPYKKELVEPLKEIYGSLITAVESLKAEDLYSKVTKAESLPYDYGKVFGNKFTLSEVPDLMTTLDDEQKRALSNEKAFLMNNFSTLNRDIKDEIIEQLRERAEVLCSVIEALFYYIRSVDKENYFEGMSSSEIIEDLEEKIEKASREAGFSFKGPFENSESENEVTTESSKAFWQCEKNLKKFVVQATVKAKELNSEANIGISKGLKFSLLTPDDKNPDKSFAYFDANELASRVKLFYDSKLKR
jgi:hypothetical protein